jgi:hypothetical protein
LSAPRNRKHAHAANARRGWRSPAEAPQACGLWQQADRQLRREAARIAPRCDCKRRALNDAREITADDTWANVACNFSHQPEKDGAVAMLERVEAVRRGAALLHDSPTAGSFCSI